MYIHRNTYVYVYMYIYVYMYGVPACLYVCMSVQLSLHLSLCHVVWDGSLGNDYKNPFVQVPHPVRSRYLFLGPGAANSGFPMQSPSKHRTCTETNMYLAKGDLGTWSVL